MDNKPCKNCGGYGGNVGCDVCGPPIREREARGRLARTPCSAFVALMASIERIRDRAKQYAEEDEAEECYEAAEKQRKVEGTLNEILRIGKVLESNLTQNIEAVAPHAPYAPHGGQSL